MMGRDGGHWYGGIGHVVLYSKQDSADLLMLPFVSRSTEKLTATRDD